jgi:hypothetical protein
MQARFALGAQEALRCGPTHGEQLTTFFFCELQVPVSFQQRYQAGQGRYEPFGTDIVGRLPGQNEGLLYRGTVPLSLTLLEGDHSSAYVIAHPSVVLET